MSINHGGPAFPAPNFAVPYDLAQEKVVRLGECQGMTRRQWLAGMALMRIRGQEEPEQAAIWAHKYADAIIAFEEREAK